MSRFSFSLLKVAAVLLAAGSALVPFQKAFAECKELSVLTWEGYADDAWIKPFEQKAGVTVARTYVGSNDEYMAKLAAGGGGYDVVVIVSSLGKRAIESGFVEPIDISKVSHFKELFEPFQKVDFDRKGDEVYGVPTFWGTSPVTVNSEVIPEGNDFGVLFDPKYKGRIGMWDDVSTIADVANYMGFDNIWTLSDEQLDQVKQKMIEQKPLVRKYWSQPGEGIELFASGEIIASNSYNYITQALITQGRKAREFVPNRPIGWVDSHFIVKNTDCREAAHQYIDHLISPESQARIGEVTGYSVSNPQSKALMNKETWERLYMDEGPELLTKIRFWDDIPRRARYLEIMNEIKAAQ
jgi:putative spermidine/putrescine transport system substrate-binding protein/spermidine/putrescine transport system substrate-binding protein